MNVTLAACYGEKTAAFTRFIETTHRALAALGPAWLPYAPEQVHATVIGLEGERLPGSGELTNTNFRALRGELAVIQLGRLLTLLRSVPPLTIQLGGFQREHTYPFTSRGEHVYQRAFSCQGERAVAIGWPRMGDAYPPSLAALRRSCEPVGVLHKYHPRPDSFDNDFFLVLGRIAPAHTTGAQLAAVSEAVRVERAREPLLLAIGPDALQVIGYADPSLPRASSVAYPLSEISAAELEALYDA